MLQSSPSSLPSLFRQIGQILLAFSWWWWGWKSHLNIFGKPYILMLTVTIQQKKSILWLQAKWNEIRGLGSLGTRILVLLDVNEMDIWAVWSRWRNDVQGSSLEKCGLNALSGGQIRREPCTKRYLSDTECWLMAVYKPSGRCQPHPANCKICFSSNESKGKKQGENSDDR